jgi:RNA 2',3'-cyclic 3'-phosphodiesterase
MNIFLGLPLPEESVDLLINSLLQEHPSWQNHKNIRWTLQASHHVTVHFFGTVLVEDLKGFINTLSDFIINFSKFQVEIIKIDNFPKKQSDLVAGYIRLSSSLAQLYNQVEQAVERHHFAKEQRPYLPHITLCRSKKKHFLRMEPILLADFQAPISSLILYQTQSTAHGSVYLPLEKWSLKSEMG